MADVKFHKTPLASLFAIFVFFPFLKERQDPQEIALLQNVKVIRHPQTHDYAELPGNQASKGQLGCFQTNMKLAQSSFYLLQGEVVVVVE